MKTLKIFTLIIVILTLVIYIIKLPMFLHYYAIWIIYLSVIELLDLLPNPKIIPLVIILLSILFILIPVGIYFSNPT